MPPKPVATYRLQLRPGFGLAQSAALIDYFKELGISHIYTSSYLQAAKDSTHGYDIVDPSTINSQLGDEKTHAAFCERINAMGLGHMVDVVPNHMAIIGKQNPWWWDVLENGPSSPYAVFFDVDWDASEERWPNKVLLPILGDHYGRVLEKNELHLSYQNGQFSLKYLDQDFPIDPSSLSDILHKAAVGADSRMLSFLADSFSNLPRPTVVSRKGVERRHRDKAVLIALLDQLYTQDRQVKDALNKEISKYNSNPDLLDAIIEQQNYRLAYWTTANKDLGYRRFFDIKELIGMRVEDFDVFKATHVLLFKWYNQGWVHGLRVDHPDGLRDPTEYFIRLANACPNAWMIAEKILQPGEKLPAEWKNVSGTTGYDFLNMINCLFIDPRSEQQLSDFYFDYIGEKIHFAHLVYQCKRLVLKELFGSELNRLVTLFVSICEKHRRYRDYTRVELHDALIHVASGFPVYRSYVAPRKKDLKQDASCVDKAIEAALSQKSDLDKELLEFLRRILLLQVEGEQEQELAMRFQQLTGPAMAKGFEDTALYKYHRLIALNEVGSDPSRFGISLKEFHDACQEAQLHHPLSLIASTTHDTKRSEDCRARLALLSEIPEAWRAAVSKWTQLNDSVRNEWVDRNTEYLLYQTLVGAWPISEERVQTFMEKAIKEAKVHTSWVKPNKDYEEAIRRFVHDVLHHDAFIKELTVFLQPLIHAGYQNSLSQTLLKLTIPGVPDIYQGSELWNFTLVDPDNRSPVDYEKRKRMLQDLKSQSLEEITSQFDNGYPKLKLIHDVLQFRKENGASFGPESSYKPLYTEGAFANHLVCFQRGENVVVAVPRLCLSTNNQWDNTSLSLPSGNWRNLLTQEQFHFKIQADELFARFPVALLVREA